MSKKGILKSEKSKQIMVLTKEYMSWYRTWADVYRDKYISTIHLPFIYRVMRDESSIPAFSLEVSMRFNSKKKEMGRDTLVFGCETEFDRDRWIAAIDYLKIKAGYDNYRNKNALVNFYGKDDREMHESFESDPENEDIEGLLYDFGKRFLNS